MAFTVEDGNGLPNANAYITVEFFDEYFTDRGDATIVATPQADKQTAIVRATSYVDSRFGSGFRGRKRTREQALEWPRNDAFDNDGFLYSDSTDAVPRLLQRAIAEYTRISIQIIPLIPIPALMSAVRDPATGTVSSQVSGQITKIKNKVDVVEEDTEYSNLSDTASVTTPGAAQSSMAAAYTLPAYPIADVWLHELMNPTISKSLGRG